MKMGFFRWPKLRAQFQDGQSRRQVAGRFFRSGYGGAQLAYHSYFCVEV